MASTFNSVGRRTHVMTPKKNKTKLSSPNDFEIWDDNNEEPKGVIRTPQKKSTRANAVLGTPSKTPSVRKAKALGESNSGHTTPQKVADLLFKKILDGGSVPFMSQANDENSPGVSNVNAAGVQTPARRVRPTTNLDTNGAANISITEVARPTSETDGRAPVHQIDDEEDEELLRMYANIENMPPAVPLPGVDPANDTAFGNDYTEEEFFGSNSRSPTDNASEPYGHGDQIEYPLSGAVLSQEVPVPSSTISSNRTTPIGAFTSPIPFEEFEAVTRKIVDATYEIRRGPLGELSVEHLIKDNWRVSIPSSSIISLAPSPTEAIEHTGGLSSSPVLRGMFKTKGGGTTPPPRILDGKSAIEHRLNHLLIKPSASPEPDFEIYEDNELEVDGTVQGSLGAKVVQVPYTIEESKDLSILHYGDGFGDPGMNIIYMRHIPSGSPPPPYTSLPSTPRSKSHQPATANAAKINSSIDSESDIVPEQKYCSNAGSPREMFGYKPSKLRMISTSSSGNEPDSVKSPRSSPSFSRNVQTQTSENVPPKRNRMPTPRKKPNAKTRKVPSQIRRAPPTRLNAARSQLVCDSKSSDPVHTENHGSVATRQSTHQPHPGRTPVKFVRSTSFNSFRDPVEPNICSPHPASTSPLNLIVTETDDQGPDSSPSARPRRYYRRSRGGTPTDVPSAPNHVIGTLMMESMRL